jgi:LysR family carnitine catabolism transcriptional activator
MNVSTRQLHAFLALAELRSFTRAAERSHLSQPAFSTLIRALEDAVGARLFDRDTRKVSLTVEGGLFEQSARSMLAVFDESMLAVRDHAERRRGRVAMALLPSLAAGWLPPVLAGFGKAYPGISVDVSDVLSEDCLARVLGGQVDFALAAVRSDASELRTDLFCTDRMHLVCRSDHRLAKNREPRLKDLSGEAFIQMARSTSVRQALDAALHPMRLNAVLEVEQLATVMGMVRQGLGVSVVPELALFHFQASDIITRPLSGKGLVRQIYMIRRRDRHLSTAAQAMYEWILARRPSKATAPQGSAAEGPARKKRLSA